MTLGGTGAKPGPMGEASGMDWDKLRVFHAVAEAGSFTHAGDTLNLSQSAVSRQISALEEALQVPLFHRHARGLILTEQGEALNRTVREVFAKLAITEALLTESKEKPAGRLKVTTTVGFGSSWLAPRLQGFLEAYPDVSISLLLDDLGPGSGDARGGCGDPHASAEAARPGAAPSDDDGVAVVASPEYLKRHGVPQRAEDLDAHRLVLFGKLSSAGERHQLAGRGRAAARQPAPGFAGGEHTPRRSCWRSAPGIGIGALSDFMVPEKQDLVRVLAELKSPKVDVFFVYPEELRNSKRVAVFRDFLLARLAELH